MSIKTPPCRNPQRRKLLRALPLLSLLPLVSLRARAAASCVDLSQQPVLASLKYVPVAPDPARSCRTCKFFSPPEEGQSCGGCTLVSAPVDAGGYCESWTAGQ